ncbi:MAG: tetratricopeptide repeat protein [Myxococcota bacterium]
MSDAPDSQGQWAVRKADGTVLRFPSLDVLQRWIRDGVVVKGDWIEHEEGGWTRVEAVTDLAVLMARAGGEPSEVPARPEPESRAPAPPPLPEGARQRPATGPTEPDTRPQGPRRPPGPPEPEGPPTVAEPRPRSLDESFAPPPPPSGEERGPDTILSPPPPPERPPTERPITHGGGPQTGPAAWGEPERAGALGGTTTTWGWDDAAVEATLRRRRRRVFLAMLVMGAAAGLAIWAMLRGGVFDADVGGEQPTATDPQRGTAAPAVLAPDAGAEEAAGEETDAGADEPEETPDAGATTAATDPDAGEQDEADDADADADADAEEDVPGPTAAEEADEEQERKQAQAKTKEPRKRPKRKPKPRPEPSYDADDFDQVMARARREASSDPVEALRLYRRALELRPGHPDALSRVGQVNLRRLGSPSKAILQFKECRKAAPRYGPCIYWLGRAYEAAGRSREAKEAYREYLAEYPGGSRAADARKRLGP